MVPTVRERAHRGGKLTGTRQRIFLLKKGYLTETAVKTSLGISVLYGQLQDRQKATPS